MGEGRTTIKARKEGITRVGGGREGEEPSVGELETTLAYCMSFK